MDSGLMVTKVNGNSTSTFGGEIKTNNNVIVSNRPIVYVTKAATQALSEATNTTIQFDTESIDTDNAFDTSTYKFTVPTGKAGIYQIQVDARLDGKSNTNVDLAIAMIYKNNLLAKRNYWTYSANYIRTANPVCNMITNLAEGDTIHGVCYVNTVNNGGADMLAGTNQSSMYILKLIG